MATIQKRKNKNGTLSYKALIRIKDGLPPACKSFPTLQEAKDWALKEEANRRQQIYFPEQIRKKRTFDELVDRYTESVVPFKLKDPSDTLRYLKHWKEKLGCYSLSQLTSDIIDRYGRELVVTSTTGNKKRTPATVNRYMATLSAVLNYGIKECEWLTINPVSKLKKLKEPRGRDRILSPDDLERFLEVCAKSSNPYLLPFVAIGISTGARKMEILSLTWSSVDLTNGFIELKETKNGTLRTICLVGLALDLVRQLYEKRNIHNPYLFPAKRRFGTLSIRKSWDSALKDAGISDYHVHDLRHQFCTTAEKSGASNIELMNALGHKSVQMTARYSHLTGIHARRLSEHVSSVLLERKNGVD